MESIEFRRSEIKKIRRHTLPPSPLWVFHYILCYLHSNNSKERPQRLWFSYRLASNLLHHRSQPVLWYFCSMTGEQVIQIRQNQVWRAIHYLQSKRWPTLDRQDGEGFGPQEYTVIKDGSSWMESSGERFDRWKGWWPESLFSRRYSTSRDNVRFPQLPSSLRTNVFPLGMGRLITSWGLVSSIVFL